MNVLFGPNEAGKSSALRAVHALLFGFGHTTADAFIHNYQQLRVGAVLEAADGTRLACVRRKGNTKTLRDSDDRDPLDESQFEAMLNGVRERFFATVFGIDHERLREGGDDIVRGQGEIGELLFAAGGVSHLRETQQAVDEQVANLFKAKGSKQQINKTLADLKTLDDELRRLHRSPEEWAKFDKEWRDQAQLVEDLQQRIDDADAENNRLNRIASALRPLSLWKDKRDAFQRLSSVVTLPDEARERFQDASDLKNAAATTQQGADRRLKKLRAELADLVIPGDLLSQADRLDDLYLRLGSHRKAATDRAGLKTEQQAAYNGARRSLEKLGWEPSVEAAREHRAPDTTKALVRRLAARHGELERAARDQRNALDALDRDLTDARQQLAALPSEELPSGFKAAHAAASSLIAVEDGLPGRRERAAQLEQKATNAISRLTAWNGSLDDVCCLKTPSEETVDAFADALRELDDSSKKRANDREKHRREAERIALQQRELELVSSVPTEDELQLQRTVRDRGVGLAVRQLRGERADDQAVEAFLHDVGDGEDFPAALESSIETVDIIADRLRRESERVAKKARLIAEEEQLNKQAGELASARELEQELRAAWDDRWRASWAEVGLAPTSPVEMRAWLRRHREAVDLADDWRSAAAALKEEEARINAAREDLAHELRTLGVAPPAAATLRTLAEEAARRVEAAGQTSSKREKFEADCVRFEKEARETRSQQQLASSELAEWKREWAEAVAVLQLAADAIPEQAEAVLANLDSLFVELDKADSLAKRIQDIEETSKAFTSDVKALCQTVAPELLGEPVDEIVSTLHRRLAAAKETQNTANEKRRLIDAEKDALQEAEQTLEESLATLDALAAEAGCETREDLPAALDASDTKRRLSADLQELETQLADFTGGKPLEAFLDEAEQEEPDRLPSKIYKLDEKIRSLRTERDTANQSMSEARTHLKQFGDESAAAEKAVERQFLLSRLEQDARTYAVALVASRLLRRAVEQYQEKSQGPVLARASAMFAALTCNSFTGLRPDIDGSGQQVLVGTRPNGTTLQVQAMSEGTQDQLYLALRLGTIEHWLAVDEHTPLPMVVDDILLTFDDERAAATLRVLLKLAKQTQILFFTHHSHLVELAQHVAQTEGNSLHRVDLLET